MANSAEVLPNFAAHTDSPKVNDLGIALALTGSSFAQGKPIPVRGAFMVDLAFEHKSAGEPMSRVMLIVIRRDEANGEINAIMATHNLPPPSPNPPPPADPKARRGGFFNVNLATVCGVLREAGKYWVMAALGDYVSQRIEFQVVPPP